MVDDTFIYNWKLKQFSLCAHGKGEFLNSKEFATHILNNTMWAVLIFPRGNEDGNYVSVYLQRSSKDDGPTIVKVQVTFQLLTSDGSVGIVKECTSECRKRNDVGFEQFIMRKELFSESGKYLRDDVLHLRCIIKMISEEKFHTKQIFSTTTIPVEKINFDWKVRRILDMHPGGKMYTQVITKSEIGPSFGVCLFFDDCEDKEVLVIEIKRNKMCIDPATLKYQLMVVDPEEIAIDLGWFGHHSFKPNEAYTSSSTLTRLTLTKYLVNGILTLRCTFSVSTGFTKSIINETFGTFVDSADEQGQCQFALDMSKLYHEKGNMDIILRTASGETASAHKAVLESRSKKFSSLLSDFEDSEAKESGIMDVPDMDIDTLNSVLKYMYTEVVDDLCYSKVLKLYFAAHEYLMATLKQRCSIKIRTLLTVQNLSNALILANDYHDRELSECVITFMDFYWDEICLSTEWENFSIENPKLTSLFRGHLQSRRRNVV